MGPQQPSGEVALGIDVGGTSVKGSDRAADRQR